MKWFLGIFMITTGVVLIIKTEWFLNFFGRIAWAENKLGAEGGTRMFYKLLGLASILFSFFIMSGRIFTILDMIFKR